MKDIYYTTQNEKKVISAMQKKLDVAPNGIIGMNTLSSLAFMVGADVPLPITLKLYEQPTIIGDDLLAWSPKAGIKGFKNSMLGSFTYPRATTPCSFLVNNGVTICGTSCHAHIGKPESVIYRLNDGTINITRAKTISELPKNIKWAVGGMGLLGNYNPEAEGFTGPYADVLRSTNHNVLGIKNGKVYGVYFKSKTAAQINTMCKNNFHFDMAILLDGGGLAAINGTESFAQINVNCKQGYAIQFLGENN